MAQSDHLTLRWGPLRFSEGKELSHCKWMTNVAKVSWHLVHSSFPYTPTQLFYLLSRFTLLTMTKLCFQPDPPCLSLSVCGPLQTPTLTAHPLPLLGVCLNGQPILTPSYPVAAPRFLWERMKVGLTGLMELANLSHSWVCMASTLLFLGFPDWPGCSLPPYPVTAGNQSGRWETASPSPSCSLTAPSH